MHPTQNDIILLIVFSSLVFAVLVVFVVSLVNINGRIRAQKQIELVRKVFETQEEERKRIALDLHDHFGQQFSAIKLHIGLLHEPDEGGHAIADTHQMIDTAMDELRMIARNLSPRLIAKSGLVAQLNDLKDSLSKTNALQINITASDKLMRFDPSFEINLYRILEEMINNTLKYAQAKNIYIAVENTPAVLKINYRDDGVGFDTTTVKEGFGLRNIETRVQFYQGRMELRSALLEGTAYAINFEKKKIDA